MSIQSSLQAVQLVAFTLGLGFALGDETCLASEESCAAANSKNETQQSSDLSAPSCRLYLGASNFGGLGIFSGVNTSEGERIGQPDILIPMIDPNMNEWSLWQDYFWDADLVPQISYESGNFLSIFSPGLGWPMKCQERLRNVDRNVEVNIESAGVHRSNDPGAGAFSYYHDFTTYASRSVHAGEELFLDCVEDEVDQEVDETPEPRSLEWLRKSTYCIDNLRPAISTLPGAGRGAFATRFLPKGTIVSPAPVIYMDRREMYIMEQEIARNGKDRGRLMFRNAKKGTQLLRNYCIGDRNSNVLLLPSAPVVNYINHNAEPNVMIRWSTRQQDLEEILEELAYDLLNSKKTLMIEYVALRDIEEGEEIFLDYGPDWARAWSYHKRVWKRPFKSFLYVSASDFEKQQRGSEIRTIPEQDENPYPDNIITVCYYEQKSEDENKDWVTWRNETHDCLRPCDVIGRFDDAGGNEVYRVSVWPMNGLYVPEECQLTEDEVIVTGIPREMIKFVDVEYTTDMHMAKAFRHEIGAPPGMFPQTWNPKVTAAVPDAEQVELANEPLAPGEISRFKWKHNGELVTKNGFRVGLPERVTQDLLDYCDRMGILHKSRKMVIDGNMIRPNTHDYMTFHGYNWYVVRPPIHYRSNMVWFSPDDENAQVDFLRVLGSAGFDQVLGSIGETFGAAGLFCYQLSLMVVNYCARGYVHYDFTNTGPGVWNVIFPLVLAEGSEPELILRNEEMTMYGNYNFEFDVAAVMGEDDDHATAANDYRDSGEMRVMASVYIADVDNVNLDRVLHFINQSYPRNDDPQYFLDNAGKHWKRGDPTKRLPRVEHTPDFALPDLQPGQIEVFRWAQNDEMLTEYAFRMGIRPKMTEIVRAYCDYMGITAKSRSLVVDGHPLEPSGDEEIDLQGFTWYVQRTAAHYRSNMHWISPNDEEAQVQFLRMLGSSGFDEILQGIGEHYGLSYLQCYHLSFMLVSHTANGFMHKDFTDPGGRVFNVIIPIYLAKDAAPELYVLTDEHSEKGGYNYEYNVAAVMGDETYHGTADCDYLDTREMRLMLSVYIAEITEENIDGLMSTLTQPYPPADPDYFFERQGIHWQRDDPTRRLPRLQDEPDSSSTM